MNQSYNPVDVFFHIRVVVGLILGLGITRLLTGLAGFAQHPGRLKIHAVHIGWVFVMLLTLVHFWWWEFRLIDQAHWVFGLYLFLIGYAILLFLLCALLFPDTLRDYLSHHDFFISRRGSFFGVYAMSLVFDVADTWLKGRAHFAFYADEYKVTVPIYLMLCGVAIWTPNRWFHRAFVCAALLYLLTWQVQLLDKLS